MGAFMWLRRLMSVSIGISIAATLAMPGPADARRRVIDAGLSISAGGTCSPLEAGGGTCASTSLPFALQIGGQTYNSFYVNSNGVLSFGSIEPYLAAQNSFGDPDNPIYSGPPPADSLSAFSVPVFSPFLADGPGFFNSFSDPQGFDGAFVATTSSNADSVTVNWFSCSNTLECGSFSAALVSNYAFDPEDNGLTQLLSDFATSGTTPEELFENGRQNYLDNLANTFDVYSLTLTDLPDGFALDFNYSPGALGDVGTYGFNLPGGLIETTGPLAPRRYVFDNLGQLVGAPVPEPGTWATMLLGFAAIGMTFRRRRRLAWAA